LSEKPRVFLVDDHELFRSGVRAELGDAVDMVGEASEVGAAVEMILERRPDVVLLDVHLPDGGGRAVVQRVAALHPRAVAYVACDPAALARDLAYFADAGYHLVELEAYDLFPMTHHVECVALLRAR